MKQNQYLFLLFALIVLTGCGGTQKKLTEYVNPFLGTANLWGAGGVGGAQNKVTYMGCGNLSGCYLAQRNGAAQPRYTVS